MRKLVFGKQLSRNRNSRTALFKSLVGSLVLNGQIKTTRAKAKAIQREIDGMMNLLSDDTLPSKKALASRFAGDKKILSRLKKEYLPLAKSRKSGFTSLTSLPPRRGDGAEMMSLKFIELPKEKTTKKDKK